MKKTSKVIALVLALVLVFSVGASALSSEEMAASVSGWLTKNVSVKDSGTDIDSYLDWTVFAMQRSGNSSYKEEYKAYIDSAVKAHFSELYLADFARIALAAMSCSISPKSVGGHNLLQAIVDTDISKEAFSGGIAYAIIALNSANGYSDEKTAELKDILLSAQRADGGFNAYLFADPSASWTLGGETDSTGIALQALACLKGDEKVDSAITNAVSFLKKEQMADGGFGSWGSASAESISQVIAGLCAIGIDPTCDDFKKGNNTMLTALSAFINSDGGARCWDGSSNIMTGYQLLCGVNAYERFTAGSVGIYEMSTLYIACHSISMSFIGQKLPAFAAFVCNVVTYIYNLIGMERYR